MKIAIYIASFLIGTVIFLCIMWGLYDLAKHVSYNLWYEDMVKETIKEMVKSGCLN